MAKYVGRRYAFGFGKETVRGTAVAPTSWLPWMEVDIEDREESVINESAYARIEQSDDQNIVSKFAEGTFAGKVKNENQGLLLLSCLGSVSSGTAAGETAVYDHTFTVQQDNQHQALTLAVKSPNDDLRFPRCVVDRLTYNFELGQYLNFEAHFLGEQGASATNTVSFTTEYDFVPNHAEVKIENDKTSLAGGTAVTLRSANITIDSQAELENSLGSLAPTDVLNKSFKVEGELTFVHNNATYHDLVMNETEKAIRLDMINTDIALGVATTRPQLQITLAKCRFSDYQRSIGRDGMVTESVKFMAHYSTAETEMVEIILTNETASY